jgi:hypothetical protein
MKREEFAELVRGKCPEITQLPNFVLGNMHYALTLASNYNKPLIVFLYNLNQSTALPTQFLLNTICNSNAIKTLVHFTLNSTRTRTSSFMLLVLHRRVGSMRLEF